MKEESYSMFARNGCVIARVTGEEIGTDSFKEIPFKRTVARYFQDLENGGAVVNYTWVDGKEVSIKLHFPRGRRKISYLRKQAKKLSYYFEFFEFSEKLTVFQVCPELCR